MTANDPHAEMPPVADLLQRQSEFRSYVELTDEDLELIRAAWQRIEDDVPEHVDDFYAEIARHPEIAASISGGPAQVRRLKESLTQWLKELMSAQFDEQYVQRRWMVGWRHVNIGLHQIWTAASMTRLRNQILKRLAEKWKGSLPAFQQTASAVTRLMDMDLALIQEAYHTESVAGQLKCEHEFAEAVVGTTESIVLLINEHSEILRSNRFVAQLLCGQHELTDTVQRLEDLLPAHALKVLGGMLAAGTHPEPVVTTLEDAQKRQRHVRWYAREIEYRDYAQGEHSVPARLLVGHDVTDLMEAKRRAVQQERLAAIGQTMTGLAHESRNAFQRSQASLETLALEVNDRASAVELIERIQRAHDHLLHLYEEVLQFAKPVRLELEMHQIGELITRTWTHICLASGCARDQLEVTLADDVESVLCDAFAVEQILRNIIENAIAVTPTGAKVEVECRGDWQGSQSAVRIEVRDHGPGIRQEYFDKIFEPFFSTRARGTGLGLPIARRLAEAHGGSLELAQHTDGALAILILPTQATGDAAVDLDNHPDYRRN